MIVGGCILVIILVAFWVPKKYLRKYFFVSIILFSCLYYFFEPAISFDLYRHYTTLDILGKMSLGDVLGMSDKVSGNMQVDSYIKSYPVYSLYAYVFGKLKLKKSFCVFTGVIIYILLIKIVFRKNGKIKEEKWKIVFAFVFMITNFNFMNISGIRCVLSAVVFSYLLYLELVEKKTFSLCWIGYIGCCLIHSFSMLLLGIRILMFLYNKCTKTILKIMAFGMVFILPFLQNVLLLIFKNVPIINTIMLKSIRLFEIYSDENVNYSSMIVMIVWFLVYSFLLMLASYVVKYADKNELKDLYVFFLLLCLFSMGAFNTSHIFLRVQFVIIPISCIWVREFINIIGGRKIYSIKIQNSSSKNYKAIVLYLFLYVEIATVFFINIYTRYRQMDGGFSINNFTI